jgi:glycosyltransferase involved in cell wall biosynthesis
MVLSVVVPAYNEAQRIGPTIRSISKYLEDKGIRSEIIVVNDGSEDETEQVLKELEVTIPNLRHINLRANEGKGWAVREGVLSASGEFILFTDADNSTAIDHWDLFKPLFDEGADVVISSRNMPNSKKAIRQTVVREVLGWLYRKITMLILPTKFCDTQNGFKAFRGDVVQKIFVGQTIKGWAFDMEILRKAKALNFDIREVPIVWRNDKRSRMTFWAMLRMLCDLLWIKFTV